MAEKYTFNGTRMNRFVIDGKEQSNRNVTTAVEYDKGRFARNNQPVRTIVTTRDKKLKMPTMVGDVTMKLNVSMQARRFEVGNPSTGTTDSIWDVLNARVWSTGLQLPTGYSMSATPTPRKAWVRTSKTHTYPLFTIRVKIEVGPVVGKWTPYEHSLTFDTLKGKILIA